VIPKLLEVAQDLKPHRNPTSDGLVHLRREIAHSYEKDYAVELESDAEVICTNGLKGKANVAVTPVLDSARKAKGVLNYLSEF